MARGVKRQPGCFWIEVNNEVHTFVVDDQDNPLMIEIHAELQRFSGLINTAPSSPLQIRENLRVCEDCQTSTKFISKIVGKGIMVRDANCFHHFENGVCSCMDYW